VSHFNDQEETPPPPQEPSPLPHEPSPIRQPEPSPRPEPTFPREPTITPGMPTEPRPIDPGMRSRRQHHDRRTGLDSVVFVSRRGFLRRSA
jgi:hypothetical protein